MLSWLSLGILADTIVLSHHVSPASLVHEDSLTERRPDILEKPQSKADNLRMLLELNGGACEVVTGVTLGALSYYNKWK